MTSKNTRTRTPTFLLEREQLVRRPLEEVFEFFSDPLNLESITPPWLRFRVVGCSTPVLLEGSTIDYRLRVHGVPIRWRSLISDWRPPFEFVDQQVSGPYHLWVHRHTFVETEDGVLVRDRVEYAVPGGILIQRLFVRRDLQRIFAYRAQALASFLPDEPNEVSAVVRGSLSDPKPGPSSVHSKPINKS